MFGVDSSGRFAFRARTNRETERRDPTHAGSYTARVGNNIIILTQMYECNGKIHQTHFTMWHSVQALYMLCCKNDGIYCISRGELTFPKSDTD